ncbi:MAG: T9SS type A sorting domain-containing protein [Chitinophagaceae bacterium]|nr:T9SS type A sorting domain-containing protein [Chitinophagaceae bacterium]
MKIVLHFIFFTVLPILSIGQTASWPFTFTKPKADCTGMPGAGSNCTKWPVVNNGQWDNPATWNNGTLPAHNDIVCVPTGWTVVVKGATYADATGCPGNTTNTPRLFVFVCGTLNFDPSGKLYLACASNVNIYTGGTILASNGSSDLIKIGATIVWGGPGTGNQGNINGPYYLSDGGNGAGVLTSILKDFKAELNKPFEVALNWSTLQEYNNEGFVIERSMDSKNWVALATIESKGNSGAQTNYNYLDQSPVHGVNYYRLQQVDKNGSAEYSNIIKVTNRTTGKIAIYPNPVHTTATVYSSTAFTHNQSVQIFSINGSLIKTIGVRAGNTIQLPVADLGAGVYFIRLTENGTTVSETKLVKQ